MGSKPPMTKNFFGCYQNSATPNKTNGCACVGPAVQSVLFSQYLLSETDEVLIGNWVVHNHQVTHTQVVPDFNPLHGVRVGEASHPGFCIVVFRPDGLRFALKVDIPFGTRSVAPTISLVALDWAFANETPDSPVIGLVIVNHRGWFTGQATLLFGNPAGGTSATMFENVVYLSYRSVREGHLCEPFEHFSLLSAGLGGIMYSPQFYAAIRDNMPAPIHRRVWRTPDSMLFDLRVGLQGVQFRRDAGQLAEIHASNLDGSNPFQAFGIVVRDRHQARIQHIMNMQAETTTLYDSAYLVAPFQVGPPPTRRTPEQLMVDNITAAAGRAPGWDNPSRGLVNTGFDLSPRGEDEDVVLMVMALPVQVSDTAPWWTSPFLPTGQPNSADTMGRFERLRIQRFLELPYTGVNEEGASCPVCLDDDVVTRFLPCGHRVCSACLAASLTAGSDRCPICRTALRGWFHDLTREGIEPNPGMSDVDPYDGCGQAEYAERLDMAESKRQYQERQRRRGKGRLQDPPPQVESSALNDDILAGFRKTFVSGPALPTPPVAPQPAPKSPGDKPRKQTPPRAEPPQPLAPQPIEGTSAGDRKESQRFHVKWKLNVVPQLQRLITASGLTGDVEHVRLESTGKTTMLANLTQSGVVMSHDVFQQCSTPRRFLERIRDFQGQSRGPDWTASNWYIHSGLDLYVMQLTVPDEEESPAAYNPNPGHGDPVKAVKQQSASNAVGSDDETVDSDWREQTEDCLIPCVNITPSLTRAIVDATMANPALVLEDGERMAILDLLRDLPPLVGQTLSDDGLYVHHTDSDGQPAAFDVLLRRSAAIDPKTNRPHIGDPGVLANQWVDVVVDGQMMPQPARYGFKAWMNLDRGTVDAEASRKFMGPFLAGCVVDALDPIWTGRFVIPPHWGRHQPSDAALRGGADDNPFRQFGPTGFQTGLARARLAEYHRVFRTFKFRFIVRDPGFDWTSDKNWPVWFVDALDQLGVRAVCNKNAASPPVRFKVVTAYRPCVSTSQFVRHNLEVKVDKKKGRSEVVDTETVKTVEAVFSHVGQYYRHTYNPVTGADQEPLESYIRLPHINGRFVVPPTSQAKASGAKYTRHYLYRHSYSLPKGDCAGESVAEFSDYTPWTWRAHSRLRSVADRVVGKWAKAGEDFQYFGVAWMDVRALPVLHGPKSLVDFGDLVSPMQPMFPVPMGILLSAQAVVQTSVPAEGMQQTVAQRVIQDMKKEKMEPSAGDIALICRSIYELCLRSRLDTDKAELEQLRHDKLAGVNQKSIDAELKLLRTDLGRC